MSEEKGTYNYIDDANEMIGKGYLEPAAILQAPTTQRVMDAKPGYSDKETAAWIKLSTSFKPHIKTLKGAPLAVWLYLSLSINRHGVAFPSIQTLMDDLDYARQTILDAIVTLENLGYMTVNRGEKRYNIYSPEFAANGKGNTPNEKRSNFCTDEEDRSTFSQDRSTFSSDRSTPVDLNKKNKKEQEYGASAENLPLPMDWQIGLDKPITELPDQWKIDREVALMNISRFGQDLEPLAAAFIDTRKILPIGKSAPKSWATALRQMAASGVKAEHVSRSVEKLYSAGMTVSDPFAVVKTAIDLAHKLPPNPANSMKVYY